MFFRLFSLYRQFSANSFRLHGTMYVLPRIISEAMYKNAILYELFELFSGITCSGPVIVLISYWKTITLVFQ